MTKDIVTSWIYPVGFVVVGKYDPPDLSVGWKGGFDVEGIYTESDYLDYQSDSNHTPTDLQDYLNSKVIDRLIGSVIEKCKEGAF